MTLRRHLAASLTALVVLAGCGSDVSGTSGDTTTTALSDPIDINGTPTSGPAAVNDDEFTAAIAPLRAQIAGSPDLCGIVAMLNTSGALPDPTGPAQIKEAIELTADIFGAIGERIAAEDPASAEVIATSVASLRTEAEAAGYTDEILANNTAFNSPEFTAAMTSATTISTRDCADETGVPAEGDTGQ